MSNKMDLIKWDGGLQLQEIEALDKISAAFVSTPSEKTDQKNQIGNSLAQQLGAAFNKPVDDGMFPWKGYAGFRFVDSKGYEGEFDLLLITHERVIIVELKELAGKEITLYEGKWFCDGYEKYKSPVTVTQNKVYLLRNKLNKIRHKFKKQQVPFVDFIIVLSNNNDYSQLPDQQRVHVIGLNEFLKLADEKKYNERFKVRGNDSKLNKEINIFDALISDGNVKPKHLIVNGYKATVDDQIFPFEGQGSVYKEFQATSVTNPKDWALLRQWDFEKIDDPGSNTPEGRFKIVSHEKDVLIAIKNQAPDLYRYCLQSKTNPTAQEVTRQFHELYELPADHQRFNEYVNQYIARFDEDERLLLAEVLLNQFAELHQINIAHRDIGTHSLWLSPSKKITLSSFISAYYQPQGTVGPRRKKLNVGVIPLPEDDDTDESFKLGTPYHRDIFALAVVIQLILTGKNLAKANIPKALEGINTCGLWYGEILRKAISKIPSDRYKNAREMHDALVSARPRSEDLKLHDDSLLDVYRKSITPYKVYPSDNELYESSDKEVYQSGDFVIKLWHQVNPDIKNPKIFQAVLSFCQRAEKLTMINVTFLPQLIDFGISTKTSQLYLVQSFAQGKSWSDWALHVKDLESIKKAIKALIQAIEYLHNIEIFHGDLHPENVLVDDHNGEIKLTLIDHLDFALSTERVGNHKYTPEYVDTASVRECDNYAVMRMSIEALGLDWNNLDSNGIYSGIATAIENEKSGPASFLSLERFNDAFDAEFTEKVLKRIIAVHVKEDVVNKTLEIFPDNGELFLRVDSAEKNGELTLSFAGIGGCIVFFFDPGTKKIKGNRQVRMSESPSYWERANSQLIIDITLKIIPDKSRDYAQLESHLIEIDELASICKSVLHDKKMQSEKNAVVEVKSVDDSHVSSRGILSLRARDQQRLSEAAEEKINSAEEIISTNVPDIKIFPKPHEIWKALIETEIDALPMIAVTEKASTHPTLSLLKIPFFSSVAVMDLFKNDDEVELFKKVDDKEYTCGRVNVKESNSKFLYVTISSGKNSFDVGATFYLRTSQDRSSFIRRKNAVNRILARTSVITDLVDYFGVSGKEKAIQFSKPPTEDDFKVYDMVDDKGSGFRLNEQQKSAFSKLVTTGPVSLLQGPPGTGKTEFIAAFTHYLITKEGARHILLVSQSHEAVNNAAEKIRLHCKHHNTKLDVVRFSNKSTNISSGLIDAYSVYLVEAKLEEFRAQFKERLMVLQKSLKLPVEYLEAIVDKEIGVGKKLLVLKQLEVDLADTSDEEHVRYLQAYEVIKSQIIDECADKYGITIQEFSIQAISDEIDRYLNIHFGVAPNEAKRVKQLITLMRDYQERLETNSGSYEEFLARSRTLVCGTCVGMGMGHLSVKDNKYDWVIIDEAARSISSEIAIAMQSGKRVLLVGDHKQLPPLYEDDHKIEISKRFKLDKRDPMLEWILKSDFERAFQSDYGNVAGAKLLVQYRMIEPIGNLVSDVFYDGELKTGDRPIPDIYQDIPEAIVAPVTWLDTSSLGKVAYDREDDFTKSRYNLEEIDQIIQLLHQINSNIEFCDRLREFVKTDDFAIGVICMYAAQSKRLSRKFEEQSWPESFKSLVKIDTVDSYQGKENRIIIVSTTLNSNDKNPRFLQKHNRINVAMSRAMDRLVIVGSTAMWQGENSKHPLGMVAKYIQEKQGEDYKFVKATRINQSKKVGVDSHE